MALYWKEKTLVWKKKEILVDPFPFRVGEVRLQYPGTLNGEKTIHDPREEFKAVVWTEESV